MSVTKQNYLERVTGCFVDDHQCPMSKRRCCQILLLQLELNTKFKIKTNVTWNKANIILTFCEKHNKINKINVFLLNTIYTGLHRTKLIDGKISCL